MTETFVEKVMAKGFRGDFTRSFMSLQLQLEHLLEEAGGDEVVELLDLLACFRKSERSRLLPVLREALANVLAAGVSVANSEDRELESFEEGLYENLVTALESANSPDDLIAKPREERLSLVPDPRNVIDLDAARATRQK